MRTGVRSGTTRHEHSFQHLPGGSGDLRGTHRSLHSAQRGSRISQGESSQLSPRFRLFGLHFAQLKLNWAEGCGHDQPHRLQRRFFAPARRFCPRRPLGRTFTGKSGQSAGGLMTYSYTQISQYLTCPRRYRHRYLDGWQEKDTRAAMLFGRAFERALAAYFLREDAAAVLFREWSACQNQGLQYSNGDTWDRMLQQGIQLLDRFCQDDRIRIRQPHRNQQIKFTRPVSGKNDFVAYVDAIGTLDGTRRLLEWKTTSARYSEEPHGLLALDPQLVCYSWMTGISEVAQVVFVRKRLVEIQYFQTTITDEQRREFGQLVEDTVRRIESAQFLPHSGIRFPQNPCSSCPYVGLCLGQQELVDAALTRRPGAENLGWLDELTY